MKGDDLAAGKGTPVQFPYYAHHSQNDDPASFRNPSWSFCMEIVADNTGFDR